jgi:hypothetical protein
MYCQAHSALAFGFDAAESAREVAFVEPADLPQVVLERLVEQGRQHGHPVLIPLARAGGDLVEGEIEILDAEPERFVEPEPGAIEQGRDDLGYSDSGGPDRSTEPEPAAAGRG